MLSLISLTQTPPDERALQSEKKWLEPAFCIVYQGQLSLNTQGWSKKAKAYYAHAVVRSPTTLWLHVQRINLLVKMADAGIYGALLDLFLVLNGKGTPLRQRMLALAKPLLSKADHALLEQQLRHTQDPLPTQATGSMLAPDINSRPVLVTNRQQNQEELEDALITAQQQLEIGQVELAQKTLETAVIAEPKREELHKALLEIYRHSRDGDRIQALWQQLKKTCSPEVKAEWHHLVDQFYLDRDKA